MGNEVTRLGFSQRHLGISKIVLEIMSQHLGMCEYSDISKPYIINDVPFVMTRGAFKKMQCYKRRQN